MDSVLVRYAALGRAFFRPLTQVSPLSLGLPLWLPQHHVGQLSGLFDPAGLSLCSADPPAALPVGLPQSVVSSQ